MQLEASRQEFEKRQKALQQQEEKLKKEEEELKQQTMAMSGVITEEKANNKKMSLWDFAASVDPNFSNHHSKYNYQVFNAPFDHQWYQPYNSKKELQEITVDGHSTVIRGGRKCNPFDLYTVNYKAWQADPYTSGQQKLVLDSYREKPRVF